MTTTTGTLKGILVRETSATPARLVDEVVAVAGRGLTGDKRMGKRAGGNRQVTLITVEDLRAASAAHGALIDHAGARRNLLVAGIALDTLLFARIIIGDVELEGRGPCDPCAKMDRRFGAGAQHALAGRGGVVARVVTGGVLRVGAPVVVIPEAFADEG